MARREEVVAHEAIRQNVDAGKLRHAPKQFDEARLLLVIQEERAVGNATNQMAALVGLEVAQRPHGVHYTIISHNPTTRTPPLGSGTPRQAWLNYHDERNMNHKQTEM